MLCNSFVSASVSVGNPIFCPCASVSLGVSSSRPVMPSCLSLRLSPLLLSPLYFMLLLPSVSLECLSLHRQSLCLSVSEASPRCLPICEFLAGTWRQSPKYSSKQQMLSCLPLLLRFSGSNTAAAATAAAEAVGTRTTVSQHPKSKAPVRKYSRDWSFLH